MLSNSELIHYNELKINFDFDNYIIGNPFTKIYKDVFGYLKKIVGCELILFKENKQVGNYTIFIKNPTTFLTDAIDCNEFIDLLEVENMENIIYEIDADISENNYYFLKDDFDEHLILEH